MHRINQTEHDLIPEYQCHKIVRAAKITAIRIDPAFVGDGSALLAFGDINLEIQVDNVWIKRNGPIIVGGYYVVYSDGYRSYSPGKEFDKGYSKLVATPTVSYPSC